MKSIKKLYLVLISSVLLLGGVVGQASAYGYYPHHGGYYPHGGYYHHDRFASGLVVGGLFGVMAGAAIASQPRYYPSCYREPVSTQRFCDYYGCYDRTAWREVCN